MTEQTKQKRQELKQLSMVAKMAIQTGQYDTINQALIGMYADQEDCFESDFNTFIGWKEKGYKIKKGSKAFLIWGSPRNLKNKEEESENIEDEFKFFPLCYLFSKNHVEEFYRKTA